MTDLPAKYESNAPDTASRLSYDLSIRPGMSIRTYISCWMKGAAFAVLEEARQYFPATVVARVKTAAVAGAIVVASAAGVAGVYNSVPVAKAAVVASSAGVADKAGALDAMVFSITELPQPSDCNVSLLEVLGIGQLEPATGTYRLPEIKRRF